MRALIGFILGVLVTIGCAYEYDASTGRAANGLSASSAEGQAPMVNWGIVSDNWQNFQAHVRATADNLEQRLKQHTG